MHCPGHADGGLLVCAVWRAPCGVWRGPHRYYTPLDTVLRAWISAANGTGLGGDVTGGGAARYTPSRGCPIVWLLSLACYMALLLVSGWNEWATALLTTLPQLTRTLSPPTPPMLPSWRAKKMTRTPRKVRVRHASMPQLTRTLLLPMLPYWCATLQGTRTAPRPHPGTAVNSASSASSTSKGAVQASLSAGGLLGCVALSTRTPHGGAS